jgi:hypothetical protein
MWGWWDVDVGTWDVGIWGCRDVDICSYIDVGL